MIEKTCEIINDEYCCDIDITIDEWKQLLTNTAVFDDKSKEAIKKWYIEPRHTATCSYIGEKYNQHSMSANGIINGLARRVQKELVKAIEELNIFSDNSYSDETLVSDIGDSDISSDSPCFEYSGKPKNKKESIYMQNKYLYPRSHKVSINALRHANYICEFDNTHLTFVRRNSDLNYTEPHHLVPIAYQNDFVIIHTTRS